LRVLDLFSGIGGFSLGLERAGMRTVAFCEIEPGRRRLLARHWPNIPCYEDVRELTAVRLAADGISVDVICGGFPCQDISQAGKREGIDGQRSGLWSEYARLVRELRPRFIIVENVSDLLHRGLGRVLGDLAEDGYDAEWSCISASFVGLPQSRTRVWIVAYPNRGGCPSDDERVTGRPRYFGWLDDDRLGEAQAAAQACAARAWRSDDGVRGWVDRMSGLGNAVVPQIPEAIGRAIMTAERIALTSTQSESN
jgi:DNA (cytosine-5)-methyltransferase 1